ncbi:MAG: PstS family phosphate ABC transporter substrate-binding protein [Scytolyngbya sp. HA4215-MV1]|jgi:phosphate transport system substrate-binding protein|nr:PstS family phosphate ABC transporter substrate-binding protein [Scytolyngbya sp. HA4215-MV1]
MAQKNDTPALVAAFLITAGLVGGGLWWFTHKSGSNLGGLIQPSSPTPSSTASAASSPQATPSQLASSFSQVANIPSGTFSYGGSTSWAPLRLTIDPAIQAARPEFRLRYVDPIGSAPNSDSGIRMLLDGQIAFSQSSRPVKDEEYQRAQQRGFRLNQIAIAIDGIAFAIHPSLDIPGLTLSQLKDIYTGKLTNWQQVGGPSLTITPYSRPEGSGGTVDLFIGSVLEGQALGSNIRIVSTTTQALRELATTPGGIYFASAPEIVPQCTVKPLPIARRSGEFVPPYQEPFVALSQCPNQRNRLNISAFQSGEYPITRNLFVIIKQNNSSEQKAGEAYANLLLSQEGQELILKTGFVRIR